MVISLPLYPPLLLFPLMAFYGNNIDITSPDHPAHNHHRRGCISLYVYSPVCHYMCCCVCVCLCSWIYPCLCIHVCISDCVPVSVSVSVPVCILHHIYPCLYPCVCSRVCTSFNIPVCMPVCLSLNASMEACLCPASTQSHKNPGFLTPHPHAQPRAWMYNATRPRALKIKAIACRELLKYMGRHTVSVYTCRRALVCV